MSRAIVTKFLGPTSFKPSRIRATVESLPSLIFGKDGLENELLEGGMNESKDLTFEVHKLAAQRFADKYQWRGRLVGGAIHDGYAFLLIDDAPPRARPMSESDLYACAAMLANSEHVFSTEADAASAGVDSSYVTLADVTKVGSDMLEFLDGVTDDAPNPEIKTALLDSSRWLGKLIADKGHLKSVMPNHAVNTLCRVEALIKKMES